MKTTHSRYDPDAIRQATHIVELLKARGWIGKTSSDGWRGCCPVHGGDNRQAFHVSQDGRRWYCWTGCQRGGDVIDLIKSMDGLDFRAACERLGGRADALATPIRLPRPTPKVPAPDALPALDAGRRLEMEALAERLLNDEALLNSLAASRGWEAATLRVLARWGWLGWLKGDREADGYVCFLYPNAVKKRGIWLDGGSWRWSKPDGTRRIRWHWRGWPWNKVEVWRENKLGDPMRGRTIVVEGETDAITLIDRGANDYETDVVALPDANITAQLKVRLPALFANLDVVLVPDTDAPGQQAEADFTTAVRPTAKTFQLIKD